MSRVLAGGSLWKFGSGLFGTFIKENRKIWIQAGQELGGHRQRSLAFTKCGAPHLASVAGHCAKILISFLVHVVFFTHIGGTQEADFACGKKSNGLGRRSGIMIRIIHHPPNRPTDFQVFFLLLISEVKLYALSMIDGTL